MSRTAKGKYEYWLTEEGLIKLEGWARDGLTDKQIAQNAGITESTLYEWKNKYPEISESLKRGKEVVDYQVENALLKKALGYKTTEMRLTKDGDLVEVEKEVPGDVESTEDAVVKEYDHAMDEIRYFCYTFLRQRLRWRC